MRVLGQTVIVSLGLAGVLLAFGCGTQPQEGKPAEVKLVTVKLKELNKALEEQRGKVVLLDVWAEF